MADSGYYSINDFPGDGSQTTFEVSFAGGYISKSHVSARLFRNIDKTFADTTFTWVNAYTIKVATPVPVGYTLRIYRSTPIGAPLVDYSDGALLSEVNLDTANKQAIFAAAEAADAFGTVPGNDALRDATAALVFARSRANHTGTQAISTVAGLADALLNSVSLVALSAAAGSKLVGYEGRSVWEKLGERVSVKDFGAKGDGTDDTAAIQAAVNYMKGKYGGTIFVPRGDYLIGSIDCNGLSRTVFLGEQGVGFGLGAVAGAGTRFFSSTASKMFVWASCDRITFDGITFDGEGAWAISQTGSPTVGYLVDVTVRNCHFFTTLRECLYGNFIYLKVFDSTFGFFGTPSKDRPGTPNHRHICSIGTATNTTNCISIKRNKFYYGYGTECVLIMNGVNVSIEDNNNFEQNDTTPIRFRGVVNGRIHLNWMEHNRRTICEIAIGSGTSIIDNSNLTICQNTLVHDAGVTRVVDMQSVNFQSNGWKYEDNTVTAVPITNDFSRLRDQTGAVTISDGSGAGLGVLGVGKFKRVQNVVTVRVDFGFPATANANGNKLSGLPFISDGVAVGNVLSNLGAAPPTPITISSPPTKAEVEAVMNMAIAAFSPTRGAQIATDAGATTATLFPLSGLTPFSNAQLSGKAFYLTFTYFV